MLSHQYVFSDAILNFPPLENSFHIRNMNMASPPYELPGVSLGLLTQEMFCRIDHMHMAFLRCGFSCEHQDSFLMRNSFRTDHTCVASLQCGSAHVFSDVLTE